MIGIVLSPEQVRTAPPAVRQWLESQMAADFGMAGDAPVPAAPMTAHRADPFRPAACDLPEIMRIFQRLQDDPNAAAVFLELGREPIAALHPSELYAVDLAEIAQDTGITDEARLAACFNHINGALQSLRGDPDVTLVAFGAAGRCYVQEATHRAIHTLWNDLRRPSIRAQWPAAAPTLDLPIGCEPPYRCAAPDTAPNAGD